MSTPNKPSGSEKGTEETNGKSVRKWFEDDKPHISFLSPTPVVDDDDDKKEDDAAIQKKKADALTSSSSGIIIEPCPPEDAPSHSNTNKISSSSTPTKPVSKSALDPSPPRGPAREISEDAWQCTACTMINSDKLTQCQACTSLRPFVPQFPSALNGMGGLPSSSSRLSNSSSNSSFVGQSMTSESDLIQMLSNALRGGGGGGALSSEGRDSQLSTADLALALSKLLEQPEAQLPMDEEIPAEVALQIPWNCGLCKTQNSEFVAFVCSSCKKPTPRRKEALDLLFKIVLNLVGEPTYEKFSRFRKEKTEKKLSFEGGDVFGLVEALGFELQSDGFYALTDAQKYVGRLHFFLKHAYLSLKGEPRIVPTGTAPLVKPLTERQRSYYRAKHPATWGLQCRLSALDCFVRGCFFESIDNAHQAMIFFPNTSKYELPRSEMRTLLFFSYRMLDLPWPTFDDQPPLKPLSICPQENCEACTLKAAANVVMYAHSPQLGQALD